MQSSSNKNIKIFKSAGYSGCHLVIYLFLNSAHGENMDKNKWFLRVITVGEQQEFQIVTVWPARSQFYSYLQCTLMSLVCKTKVNSCCLICDFQEVLFNK